MGGPELKNMNCIVMDCTVLLTCANGSFVCLCVFVFGSYVFLKYWSSISTLTL